MITLEQIGFQLVAMSTKEESELNDLGTVVFNAATPNGVPRNDEETIRAFTAICLAVSSACDALEISTADMATVVEGLRRCPLLVTAKAEEPS